MRASSVLAFGTLAVAQNFQSAREIEDNTPGVSYTANLVPKEGAAFQISGTVVGTAATDGNGVDWSFSLNGFDASQGPFAYHIHDQPVAEDGNCSSTLAHLDPTRRGQEPPCDKADISKCEVGDLAGKYGKIESDSFSKAFHDDFTSTTPGLIEFFGNRSITFHLPNTTRIACANFALARPDASGASTGVIPYPSGTGAPYPSGTGIGGGNGTETGPYPTGDDSTPAESGIPSGPSASSAVPGETGTGQDGAAPSSGAGMISGGMAGALAAAGVVAALL